MKMMMTKMMKRRSLTLTSLKSYKSFNMPQQLTKEAQTTITENSRCKNKKKKAKAMRWRKVKTRMMRC